MRTATACNAFVATSLMAAVMFFAPQVSRADDTPVSDPPRSERPTPAWTAARAAEAEREKPPVVDHPIAKSYQLELAGAYAAIPVLAFGLMMVSLATDLEAVHVIAVSVVGLAIPASVHLLNGQPTRAALSFFLLPAIVVCSAIVFAMVGAAISGLLQPSLDAGEDSDERFAETFGAAAISGLVGGALALITYAAVDIVQAKPATRSSWRLAVAPRPDGAAAVLAGRF
jgi:hypothetical protein